MRNIKTDVVHDAFFQYVSLFGAYNYTTVNTTIIPTLYVQKRMENLLLLTLLNTLVIELVSH